MPSEIDLSSSVSLPEGSLQTVAAPHNGLPVLLTRQQGQVYALAAHCPHYGAPLEKGRVVDGRLVCPWHHACFRVDTGELCEPPALDDLPSYRVREAHGRILVQLPAHSPASTAEPAATPTAEVGGVPPAPVSAATDERTFVVVGAGAAGYFAAQALRRKGFAGRLVLITAEAQLPYDRTKLSKAYLAGKAEPAALPLREKAFYAQQGIELLTNARVTGIRPDTRQVLFATHEPLGYDQLLLAPGAIPTTPPQLPGQQLRGVLALRSRADADALLAATAEAQQVVIVGAGFIGMEAASSLVASQRQVTVVTPDALPFEKLLGPEIGAMFKHLHEAKGVQFVTGTQAAELLGTAGQVRGVRLESGAELPADAVVLGVGVRPASEFLADTFKLDKDGGLPVDAYLQAAPNVYAAGDLARFPLAGGATARIEHWRLAQQQGHTAACNMLGQAKAFAAVPFFWTQQYGKSLRYLGHAEQYDDILYHGTVADQKFLAFYVLHGRIVAVAGMGHDTELIYIAELLRRQAMPPAKQLPAKPDWAALAAEALSTT